MIKTLVVAATRLDYLVWCRDNQRHPYGKGVVYATRYGLRGMSASKTTELIILPNAERNPHYDEIMANIRVIFHETFLSMAEAASM